MVDLEPIKKRLNNLNGVSHVYLTREEKDFCDNASTDIIALIHEVETLRKRFRQIFKVSSTDFPGIQDLRDEKIYSIGQGIRCLLIAREALLRSTGEDSIDD